MQMFDGMSYATTRELVAAVVATLDLPLGLVDHAEIDRWRDSLAARGGSWTSAARAASPCQATTGCSTARRGSGLMRMC